ncbi:MAG: bifunctional adenosylcobinamide kinase/adenosylcobinamide-phosphate guanylyltransferase [Akkermansia sp.]
MHAINPQNTPNLTLILGGTRSGKSEYAEQLASKISNKVLYIATAENRPGKGSLEARIRKHRERRPSTWQTLECPLHLAETIRNQSSLTPDKGIQVVLLDCLTLLSSNILFAEEHPEDIDELENKLQQEISSLLQLIQETDIPWIIVSSETGLGIASNDQITRNYCDGLGMVNRMIANQANQVALIVAGLPLYLKK